MNINPKAKRALCYGDSITHGSNHESQISARYPINVRWTGILQKKLGLNYEIIEEGLGGRTTNLNDPKDPGRNGLSYFSACLASHFPLDLIILLLGTNDLKDRFHKNPQQIAQSIKNYITIINSTSFEKGIKTPKILLLSPPLMIQEKIPSDWDFTDSTTKSKQLSIEYQLIAKKENIYFFDLSSLELPVPVDGTHPNAKGHKIIGLKIAELVKNIQL